MQTRYETAIANFQEVLGFDKSNTIQLVEFLENTKISGVNTHDRFTKFSRSLGLVNFKPSVPSGNRGSINGNTNANTIIKIGSGTFGKIFRGQHHKELTYKLLVERSGLNAVALEEFYRGVFLEAWIQTILSSDPTHGKNIGKVLKLKRTTSPNGVFIIMEFLPLSLPKLFEFVLKNPNGVLTMGAPLSPMLIELSTVLTYFSKHYNFFHRDLHLKNIMISVATVKIIDFGLSCIQFTNRNGDKVFYSMPNTIYPVADETLTFLESAGKSCFSYDLLTFMTSLDEYYIRQKLADLETTLFFELLYLYTKPDGSEGSIKAVLAKLQSQYLPGSPFFHLTYPSMFNMIDSELLKHDIFRNFKPANFLAIITDVGSFLRSFGKTKINALLNLDDASGTNFNNTLYLKDIYNKPRPHRPPPPIPKQPHRAPPPIPRGGRTMKRSRSRSGSCKTRRRH